MQYRKDIDGLRTIAVFLVIFNHAGFELFSGGFIGVDVFFVISGFLITSIIYPKIQEGTFEFGWFLSRRIRRLMPVLFVVMGTSALVFSLTLLPNDLTLFYKSLVSISLYLANFFFWIEHGGYFAGTTQEVPLLHTWSLAVEEQYYFIWPLILILMVKIFSYRNTILITLTGLLFSVWFSQWATEVTIGAAYYLLPTRFFELLAGSFLALSWKKLDYSNALLNHFLSILGLILIIYGAVALNHHSSFPGYNALYPVIGTFLLISSKGGIVNQLFSLKPIVYLGAISYSLYLWHWPILVYARYTATEMTLLVQLLSIVLTIILSVFSYHFVEQKFRHSTNHSFKDAFTKVYLYPTIIFIAFSIIGIQSAGFPERFNDDIVKKEAALHTFANETRKGCHSPLRDRKSLPTNDCRFGQLSDNTSELFIFGDSHANHLVPFFEELAMNSQISGIDYTMDQCVPVFDLQWGSNKYKANECKLRNDQARDFIQNNNFKYVVLAASWPGISTKRIFEKARVTTPAQVEQIFTQQMLNTLQTISNTGAIPIIAYDTPELTVNAPNCTLKKELFNGLLNCETAKNKNAFLRKVVKELKSNFPMLIEVDIQSTFCVDDICAMELNGVPLFRDADHLNEKGATIIAKKYLSLFDSPFVNKAVEK